MERIEIVTHLTAAYISGRERFDMEVSNKRLQELFAIADRILAFDADSKSAKEQL